MPLVFDLDGTLVDTAPDLQAHVNSVLEELGRPGLDLNEVRLLVGDGARTLLRRGLEATGGVPAGSISISCMAVFSSATRRGRPTRAPCIATSSRCSTACESAGLRLGVCTNKAQAPTDRLLAALGLDRFFEAIVGGDAVPAKKPDPGHLRAVLERLGASPARSVMVGDSAHDLQAARTLGVPCVLVSFGYTPVPARALGAESGDRPFRRPAGRAREPRRAAAGHRRTRAPCTRSLDTGQSGFLIAQQARRAVSSAGEHALHTRGVAGSIPAPPTTAPRTVKTSASCQRP